MIAIKVVLITFGILVSIVLCTVAYGIVASYFYGWRAVGLPALLRDPLYWLLLILLLGGWAWLGATKLARQ